MLDALKKGADGIDTGDNLEYVAEYCEDLNFAEVAVNNRCIGVCLIHLTSKVMGLSDLNIPRLETSREVFSIKP